MASLQLPARGDGHDTKESREDHGIMEVDAICAAAAAFEPRESNDKDYTAALEHQRQQHRNTRREEEVDDVCREKMVDWAYRLCSVTSGPTARSSPWHFPASIASSIAAPAIGRPTSSRPSRAFTSPPRSPDTLRPMRMIMIITITITTITIITITVKAEAAATAGPSLPSRPSPSSAAESSIRRTSTR
mmetsp:Transcript_15577/g.29562  ORF Transcript_15577/g.29562 Transcript_15577/m.29562 type:complete len:189 (-) Transcript_15577:731-1297(-)